MSTTTPKPLQNWTLTYGENHLLFECEAEDISHAVEQCENAYPGEVIQSARLSKDSTVEVRYWDSTYYNHDTPTAAAFEMCVVDQRHSNGQMYVDIAAESGDIDDMLSLSLEINRLPQDTVDRQCAHLHFDSDNLAMSIFKDAKGYILRPETDVQLVPHQLANGERAWLLA